MSSSLFMTNEKTVDSNRVIYTPTNFAKANLNYIQEVGTLKSLRVHESKRSGLSSYLFFIVTQGSGTLTIEDTLYEMRAGDCAFFDCMLNYTHKSSDDLWQLTWVHFNGPNMVGIFDKYLERGGKYVFTPNKEVFDFLLILINQIQEIAISKSYIRDMQINEKISVVLTELMRSSWNPDYNNSSSLKRKDLYAIRDYIDTHFTEDIKLEKLSAMFYINKFYLTRIFKKQYGVTINNYLTNIRITNSKKLLRFTDNSIEDIASSSGYKSNKTMGAYDRWLR